tara:strand:- start:46 stop:702 length:657 start_codon:yes stop_codon:yes gene_type:complete
MSWTDRAACKHVNNDWFFITNSTKITDKQYWNIHLLCRDCPVNKECLTMAIKEDYKFGIFALPERVRRRFKNKIDSKLKSKLKETYKTLDIINPTFDKEERLVSKRCLKCNRHSRGFYKDYENWGGKSHICVSCHISNENNKHVDKFLDREKPSKAEPEFDSHGRLISKRCTKCWKRKKAERFSKRPRGIGGKTSWCRVCVRKNLEIWQEKKKRNEQL